MRRRVIGRVGAIAILAMLLVGLVGLAAPAQADPLICAEFSYTVLGDGDDVGDCYVPTSWSTLGGSGPECAQYPFDPSLLQVCWDVSVSAPV